MSEMACKSGGETGIPLSRLPDQKAIEKALKKNKTESKTGLFNFAGGRTS